MNDLLKPRVVCWFVAAVVLTGGLLMLGEADDAPGLGGLGLLLGLAMVLHACRLAGLVRPGSSATILLAVCGVIAAVMPFVLYADGEIAWPSPFWLAAPLGVFLLLWARQRCHHR